MSNRNVLISGVSRGIGRSICQQLAGENYHIYGTYNTGIEEAKTIKSELGDRIELFQVNFADRKQTLAFIDKVKDVVFDAVINNAGMIDFEDFEDFDFSIWDDTLEVNLTAPLLIAQGLRKNIIENGAIVNISSTDGLNGTFASMSYAASKAALINISKSLGNIFGSKKVRVNSIAPGWIDTEMATKASEEATTLTPLNRNGQPDEIAKVVSFLISNNASFINGANVIVDGGYTNVDYIMLKESQGEL